MARTFPQAIREMSFLYENLKFLRALMCRTVVLRGSEKARIVGQIEALHQGRDELISGKTSERSIFWRNNYVEAASRRGDRALLGKPVQRNFCCCGGNLKGHPGFS